MPSQARMRTLNVYFTTVSTCLGVLIHSCSLTSFIKAGRQLLINPVKVLFHHAPNSFADALVGSLPHSTRPVAPAA